MATESPMKVTAIAPWFGGKRTLAPVIVHELGKHAQYFEPFCGGLSIIFSKPSSQKETVNDLHGDVVNLARVIASADAAPRLYESLQRVCFCEGLLDDARNFFEVNPLKEVEFEEEPGLVTFVMQERAYWFFLASWMGRNGTAGTDRQDYQIAVRWTKNGGSPTVRWRNAVESMPAWHRRLLNVVILRRDAFKFIDKFEDVAETAIYVDPPYAAETRGKIKDGAGGRYLHEFSHAESLLEQNDHRRLRDILAGYRKARIVVSYYDCPRIRELYAGWTFVEHTRQKHMHVQNGRGARPKEAPEILIVNGPSYGG